MIRRLLILIAAILPLTVLGQIAVGSWKVYPAFGDATRVIETPDLVYVASQGSLLSYDKDNDETHIYSTGVDISGKQVKDIFYNYKGRYLVVSYKDANLDILYDDGRHVNLPDIRDANVNVSKDVNFVSFDDKYIYVATSFGLVIYDEATGDVKESGVYDIGISSVAVNDKMIYLTPIGGSYMSQVRCIEKGQRINNLDKFALAGFVRDWANELYMLPSDGGDARDFLAEIGYDGKLYIFEKSIAGMEIHGPYYNKVNSVTPVSDGLIIQADGSLHKVAAAGVRTQIAELPSIISDDKISTLSGSSSLWAANVDGLGNYRLENDGSVKVLRDKYRPDEATTFSDISRTFPSTDGRGFFVSNLGMSLNYAIGIGDFFNVPFKGNFVENGKIRNIEVNSPVTIKSAPGKAQIAAHGYKIFSPTFVLEDPDDHDKYYIGSGCEGVYVIKDGKEIGRFDDSNSKIHKNSNWAWRVGNGMIDKDGNLLVAVYTEDASKPAIVVLPSDKRRKNPQNIEKNDWVGLDFGEVIQRRDLVFEICDKSDVIFLADATYRGGFAALYTGGTITDSSDDTHKAMNNFIDQDGKSFEYDYAYCFTEDHRGRVWVGTTNGPFEIANPMSAFTNDFKINRLKVPRNDGTNLADYLLDTDVVRCIAVDASNRKWIGTKDSGLYLVSENGDEILEHFDTTNSPLGDNDITSLYVDPNTNSVFVTTLTGLYEYSSTSSPAKEDYSEVYAYPNPVEPGYTGWITIAGLMDSSLVKIMDSGMHLVYQTTSEGGMAMWDGCTLNGNRVKSGVYYVLASSSDDTQSQGDVVAKILVIN